MSETSKVPKLISLAASPSAHGLVFLFALDTEGELWRFEGTEPNVIWQHIPVKRGAKMEPEGPLEIASGKKPLCLKKVSKTKFCHLEAGHLGGCDEDGDCQ